jgi:hypothetical protein
VWWTELEFFDGTQAPPPGVNVVEAGWPAGQPARASWPQALAGWRIVASSQAGGWVTWRRREPTRSGSARLGPDLGPNG